MSEEEANYGTTGAAPGDEEAGGNDYQSQMSDSDLIKLELLKGLIAKNVNLSDIELSELTGFQTNQIRDLRNKAIEKSGVDSATPLTWDYVLAFDVGSTEDKDRRMPTKKDKLNKPDDDNNEEWEKGMQQNKYYGQVFNNIWQRLEDAKLSVEAYKSEDKETMFLIVGITEENLRYWADERDTDLLIDPKGGVLVGRKKDFALARRTLLDNEDEADRKEANENAGIPSKTIDLSNWQYLYGEYSQQADPSVYKHYKRTKDSDLETPFDERTRLRIIYECIIADTNEGGAEIKIADLLINKAHPLKAVFPYHDQDELEYFDKEWIRNCNPMKWFWCPLDKVRDYFGEPVGFYFGFLTFYLRWLVAPAAVGVIFFIWQLAAGEVAVIGIPFLCFFMIFWSVAFVDFWAREEARFRLMWGMTKFQQKAVARPQFEGEWTHDKVTGLWSEEFSLAKRACRISAIYTFVSIWLSACVVSVIYVLTQRDADPNNLGLKIGLGVANAVMIFVFDAIYKQVSKYGNEWENHRTDQDFQNAMIAKSFSFKFVNSFASLFYLGFIRPTLNGPYYYVHFYDNVCAKSAEFMSVYLEDRNGATDIVLPSGASTIDQEINDFFNAYPADPGGGDPTRTECINDYTQCVEYVKDTDNNDEAWRVVTQGFYPQNGGCPSISLTVDGDQQDSTGKCYGACDYGDTLVETNEAVLSELQIQLLTLFMTAIVIQNVLEVGVPFLIQYINDRKAGDDAAPKSEAEKQSEKDKYSDTIDDMSELIIQFGFVTLFVMAFPLTPLLAIVNNILEMKVDAINLVKTSQRPDPNGSYGLGSWNAVLGFFSIISVLTNVMLITWRTKLVTLFFANDDGTDASGQWIFFSMLSVFLGIVVGIEKWIIPDVPVQVEQAIERQRLVESVLILGAGVDTEDDTPPIGDDDGGIQFDPSLEFIDVETLQDIYLEDNDGNDENAQTIVAVQDDDAHVE